MQKLYVVGIGPGDYENMTIKAVRVLESCDVIVGYTVYVDLVRAHFPGKDFLAAPMRGEVERCRLAFARAQSGQTTAMVCSGDAGVYGMSGLILEIGLEFPDVEVEIVSGVTAATAGAALLGAPLMHDFAVISLSDLLTPWEKIEKRLLAAAEADFVICLYNPSSRKRKGYLKKACELMLRYKPAGTVCGTATRIGRDSACLESHSCVSESPDSEKRFPDSSQGGHIQLCTLGELRDIEVDMFTTVFIGNAQTRIVGGRMVTPRGYMLDRNQ